MRCVLTCTGDLYECQKHEHQLEDYWKVFIFASMVETLGYFMVDQELFSMLVCLKTIMLLVTWASTAPDGSAVSIALPRWYRPDIVKIWVNSDYDLFDATSVGLESGVIGGVGVIPEKPGDRVFNMQA